jgi:hypothetical protein
MKVYGRVDENIHVSFTSALVGGERSASRPCLCTQGERSTDTHWTGTRPVPSQSLYRLRYRGIPTTEGTLEISSSHRGEYSYIGRSLLGRIAFVFRVESKSGYQKALNRGVIFVLLTLSP